MFMTIQSNVKDKILATPSETSKVPLVGSEMDETHASRSPILWAEIGESSLTGPELVLDTTDKVVLIKEKLKAERDRQKSYADKRRKPLEFEVGDRVLLKVYPWKGVVHFERKISCFGVWASHFECVEFVLRIPFVHGVDVMDNERRVIHCYGQYLV
ncbi:hypothetical protein Tco_1491138 [Tanacetum coccineum]